MLRAKKTKPSVFQHLSYERYFLKNKNEELMQMVHTLQSNNDMLNDFIMSSYDVSGNANCCTEIATYDLSGELMSCVMTDISGNFIPCIVHPKDMSCNYIGGKILGNHPNDKDKRLSCDYDHHYNRYPYYMYPYSGYPYSRYGGYYGYRDMDKGVELTEEDDNVKVHSIPTSSGTHIHIYPNDKK
jgi:hypothetical protein